MNNIHRKPAYVLLFAALVIVPVLLSGCPAAGSGTPIPAARDASF